MFINMSLRVLVTAGSEGIGKEIVDYFAPHGQSLSRRNGFDIREAEAREHIARLSLDCDIFVNHAFAGDESQTELLRIVFTLWRETRKSGYIFSTGTYGTYCSTGIDPKYIELKNKLDQVHFDFSRQIENGDLPFRLTLLRPGMLDTERSRKKPHWHGNGVRGKDYAQLIEYLYRMPGDVQISNLVIESIKPNAKSF